MEDRIPELDGLWALKQKGKISEAEYARLAALLRQQAEEAAALTRSDIGEPLLPSGSAEAAETAGHVPVVENEHQTVSLGKAVRMGCLAVFKVWPSPPKR